MRNALAQLREIIGTPQLMIGTVMSSMDGDVIVQLSGGGILTVKGTGVIGSKVYVRDGVIEGPAPDLPTYSIEI